MWLRYIIAVFILTWTVCYQELFILAGNCFFVFFFLIFIYDKSLYDVIMWLFQFYYVLIVTCFNLHSIYI